MKTLSILLLLLVLANVSVSAENAPVMLNGGFETDANSDGVPDGWQFKLGKANGSASLDDAVYKTGARSVKLKHTGAKGYVECITSARIKPLTHYEISLWFRTAGNSASPFVAVYIVDAKGKVLSAYHPATGQSAGWKSFSTRVTSPLKGTKIRINLRLMKAAEAWFDDIEMRPTGPSRNLVSAKQTPPVPVKQKVAAVKWKRAVYVAEEIQFSTTTGVRRCVKDASAHNGFSARIAPDAPPYFQCGWGFLSGNMRNIGKLLPGLSYELYVKVKVTKKGEGGTAFRTGVYNPKQRQYVAKDMRPELKNIKAGAWQVYKVGTFVLEPNQHTYVGPTRNQNNVSEIAVDNFFLTTGGKLSAKLLKEIAPLDEKATTFYFASPSRAATSIVLNDHESISIVSLFRRDPLKRVTENTFTGIVLDYELPGDKWKRVLVPVGPMGKAIQVGAALSLPWRDGKIDVVADSQAGRGRVCFKKFYLRLADYGGPNWKGRVTFALVQRDSLDTWVGAILSPLRDEFRASRISTARPDKDISGVDEITANALKSSARAYRKRRFMELLRKCVSADN